MAGQAASEKTTTFLARSQSQREKAKDDLNLNEREKESERRLIRTHLNFPNHCIKKTNK